MTAKDGKPLAKLGPVEKRRFKFGLLADKLTDPPPDFLAPMSEEELPLWEGGDIVSADSVFDGIVARVR